MRNGRSDYAPHQRIGRGPATPSTSPAARAAQFILEYRNAVMTRIRPGVTPRQIMDEAKTAMDAVFARTTFSKPAYERAARTLVESGGGVFSHTVGMAVHDVGRYNGAPLQPGQVFSVDPQLCVREENLYCAMRTHGGGHADRRPRTSPTSCSRLDDMERLGAGTRRGAEGAGNPGVGNEDTGR